MNAKQILPLVGVLIGLGMVGYPLVEQKNSNARLNDFAQKVAANIGEIKESGLYAGSGGAWTQPQPLIQEQVIELPEDGNRWQTVVVYSTDTITGEHDRRLVAAFEQEPRLRRLVQQTAFYQLTPSHWWVKQRLKGCRFPMVFLQKPTADPAKFEPVYRVQGPRVPMDAKTLADEIQITLASRADCRPQPQPNPYPPPQPGPMPDLTPNLGPDNGLPVDDEDIGLGGLILIGVSALAGGYFKRNG